MSAKNGVNNSLEKPVESAVNNKQVSVEESTVDKVENLPSSEVCPLKAKEVSEVVCPRAGKPLTKDGTDSIKSDEPVCPRVPKVHPKEGTVCSKPCEKAVCQKQNENSVCKEALLTDSKEGIEIIKSKKEETKVCSLPTKSDKNKKDGVQKDCNVKIKAEPESKKPESAEPVCRKRKAAATPNKSSPKGVQEKPLQSLENISKAPADGLEQISEVCKVNNCCLTWNVPNFCSSFFFLFFFSEFSKHSIWFVYCFLILVCIIE